VTVTSNLTIISNCDSETNWNSNDPSFGLDDIRKEGSYSLSMDVDIETSYMRYDLGSAQDYSNRVLYVWMMSMTPSFLDTKANGGMQIFIEDSSGNQSYWYVGGSDTYKGGWKCFSVYCSSTPDANNGTNADPSQVRYIGVRYKGIAKSKLSANCYVDFVRYGSATQPAVKILGGSASSPLTWEDLFIDDDSACIGVIQKGEGTYLLNGGVQFGDESSGDVYFQDKLQVLQWEDVPSIPDQFKLSVVNNPSGIASVIFGEKSDEVGLGGGLIRAKNTLYPYKVEVTDADVSTFKLCGVTFLDASTITFPSEEVGAEALNCLFQSCDRVDPSSSTFRFCTFVDAKDVALLLPSSHNVKDCSFLSNPKAIEIDTSGTFTFDNLTFTGNGIDIYNTSGGTVVIQCVNGSNPSSSSSPNGGAVEIQNVVYLRIYVKDSEGEPIPNARVAIYKSSDMTQLMNELTDGNGKAEETFQYPGSDIEVIIRVRKSTAGATRYIPIETIGVIGVDGLTQYVTMYVDTSLGGG